MKSCQSSTKFTMRFKQSALFLVFSIVQASCQAPCHPLDPLTKPEMEETVKIINSTLLITQNQGTWAFYWITLQEPVKALLLPYFLHKSSPPCNSHQIPRRAFVQLVEKRENIVTEVVVNLFTRTVESWKWLPRKTQATFTTEENVVAEQIAKADVKVQERCREMGWTNMSLVRGETWSVAIAEDRPELRNLKRPMILYMFGSLFDGDNYFAHPFDFAVVVDLAISRVISIDNLPTHSDYNPNNRNGNICPKTQINYDPRVLPSNFLRKDVHPVHFSQPQGPSYSIRGNEISWQKFNFRIGFNMREGIVIHHVSYQDGPRHRPLFYRMSVAELFVPYGDPRPPFHQKFPFDEGEFTLGLGAVDHRVAGICRGGVVAYMDAYQNAESGEPQLRPNALCIYEEDAGLLWAHMTRDGTVVHSRALRLVITSFTNLGNYDYQFKFTFNQDATIHFESELNGIMSAQLLAVNETFAGGFGTPVAPQINGQYHQHHITLRLDTEIDGNINSASTVDAIPLLEPTGSQRNPYGQGFTTVEHLLKTPEEARTTISPFTGRTWVIRNPTRVHPYTKKPVGWKLIPHNAPLPFVRKDSPFHARCAYTDYNVWVTKYNENELYPGGFYLNSSGLPEWVRERPKENIAGADIVLWYTFGYTHIPRVEDFPVMPKESYGVSFKPANFFLGNPGIDVPPPE